MEASSQVVKVEGQVVVSRETRMTIVASRFNDFIVSRLTAGAEDAFVRHGGTRHNLTLVLVPGAWEIPFAVQEVIHAGTADAIVALGAVIRGSTPHFDYVAGEVSKGVAQVSLNARIPVAFGVITTDTIEQAVERAGTKAGNKGWDAMLTAIEMVSLQQSIRAQAKAPAPASKLSSKGKR
jgi:6,7-dimethyl-8-ribityllumazine synthase